MVTLHASTTVTMKELDPSFTGSIYCERSGIENLDFVAQLLAVSENEGDDFRKEMIQISRLLKVWGFSASCQ